MMHSLQSPMSRAARTLVELVGGSDEFEPILMAYCQHFIHQSINTDQFKSFFLSYFTSNSAISSIDLATWLYAPGIPPYKPKFDKTLAHSIGNIPEDNKELEEYSAEQKLEYYWNWNI